MAEEEKKETVALTKKGFEPTTIEEAWRWAKALAESTIIPTNYQHKPGDCLIVLDLAARLDAPWLAIMQNVYTVHGRPAMDAALSTALTNRSGVFIDPLDYEVQGDNPLDQNYRVRAFATRKSTGKTLFGPWITWQLVHAEGWDSKPGSKWPTMPDQMFHYRAASWFQRRYCPELTMGMMTTQEAADLSEEPKYVESTEITAKGVEGLKARMNNNKVKETATMPEKTPTKAVEAQTRPEPVTTPPTEKLPKKSRGRPKKTKPPQPTPEASPIDQTVDTSTIPEPDKSITEPPRETFRWECIHCGAEVEAECRPKTCPNCNGTKLMQI